MKGNHKESFDPDIEAIELTESEINIAIYKGKTEKWQAIKIAEWNEKISKEREIPVFTAKEMYLHVFNKAKGSIPGFTLSKAEQEIYYQVAMYFTNDSGFDGDLKKGLMIYGNVGCGKTTMMKLFMDNQRQSYAVIECRRIASDFQKEGVEGIEKYYGYLNPGVRMMFGHTELGVCFDDMGTEGESKYFGNEANVMTEIILSRYENKMPSHITTNLTIDDIERDYGTRVRSRMREMFNQITFPLNITDKRR